MAVKGKQKSSFKKASSILDTEKDDPVNKIMIDEEEEDEEDQESDIVLDDDHSACALRPIDSSRMGYVVNPGTRIETSNNRKAAASENLAPSSQASQVRHTVSHGSANNVNNRITAGTIEIAT